MSYGDEIFDAAVQVAIRMREGSKTPRERLEVAMALTAEVLPEFLPPGAVKDFEYVIESAPKLAQTVGQLEKEIERLKPDAELGRLVRQLPHGQALIRTKNHGRFIVGTPRSYTVETVHRKFEDDPLEALRAALPTPDPAFYVCERHGRLHKDDTAPPEDSAAGSPRTCMQCGMDVVPAREGGP